MAAFLLGSLLLMLQNKEAFALLLISFTPFIRSEGLVIILTFAFFQSMNGKWKSLPYLLVGHLVFALVGAFYFKDFLWVFNRIPYANLGSPYGSGDWFHFFDKMTYVMGIPLMILFWIGFVGFSWQGLKKGTPFPPKLLLPACFAAFFIAHTIFWKFGIFNSMGLKRVFAAITPFMAIMAASVFNHQPHAINLKLWQGFRLASLVFIFLFPFTSNPAATEFERDLKQSEKHQALEGLALNFPYNRLVYADPYLSLKYSIDQFDPQQYLQLHQRNLSQIKSGDLIIWDNWHAVIDGGLDKEKLENWIESKQVRKVKELGEYYAIYLMQ